MSLITTQMDSNTALITLSDREGGNMLNSASIKDLYKSIHSASENTDVFAIIIRSLGPDFCLGMDFSLIEMIHSDRTKVEETIALFSDLLAMIQKAPKPVMCIVNGQVKGGGIGLASVCDIVLAYEEATFQFSEVLYGLIPAIIAPFISPLRISPATLRFYSVTAKTITAHEALSVSLVDEVCTSSDIEKRSRSIIKNLFRSSPKALQQLKDYFNRLYHNELTSQVPIAHKELLKIIEDKSVERAINAYKEGGLPEWFLSYKPSIHLTTKD